MALLDYKGPSGTISMLASGGSEEANAVPLDQGSMFYEVMWRLWARQDPYPTPWWVKQTLRRWIENYDGGLFDSKEAALSSNALYRYWNMVGVKDIGQKSLV